MTEEKKPVLGEKTTELLEKAPEAMAEMMREFIQKKDLNSRTSIRYRIRALLDLATADTEYPAGPLTGEPPFEDDFEGFEQPRRRRRRGGGAGLVGRAGIGAYIPEYPVAPAAPPRVVPPAHLAVPQVAPAPGAPDAGAIEEAAVDNEQILGEEQP